MKNSEEIIISGNCAKIIAIYIIFCRQLNFKSFILQKQWFKKIFHSISEKEKTSFELFLNA